MEFITPTKVPMTIPLIELAQIRQLSGPDFNDSERVGASNLHRG